MSVVTLPARRPSVRRCAPSPAPTSAVVIPFPRSPKGLTQADVATLRAVATGLGSGWFCDVHRDPDETTWAVVGSRRGHSAGDAYLVYRRPSGVVFFELDAAGKRAVAHHCSMAAVTDDGQQHRTQPIRPAG
jgi:hypothetical protein